MSPTVVPSRFADLDGARERWGAEYVDRVMQSVFLSDVDADDVVDDFRAMPGGAGWRMLDQALALGPRAVLEAPPSLERMLEPVLDPPGWFDPDLADAGAVAWWRIGTVPQLIALAAGSLAYGYQSASLARPLAATGRLTRMAPRRLGETSRWIIEVTRPGQLRPGADGLRAVVRLRLVHALVRAHLRAGAWDTANWGEPISVGDTLATGLGGFFIVPQRALEDMGVRYAPAELEAIYHLWRWISFLMGVPEEWLPTSLEEARDVIELGLAIDSGPDEDCRALMQALLRHGLSFERLVPAPLVGLAQASSRQVLGGFARRWMGDDMADRLGVPDTPLVHLAPLARPFLQARDAVRATGLLGSDERIVALEHAFLTRAMALAGAAPQTIAPEQVEHTPALAA